MKVYLVSDLHMDDGQGGFRENQKAFNDFLDMVGKDLLILNGDTVDLWKDKWFHILRGPCRSTILRLGEKMDKVVVRGNHDHDEDALGGFFPYADIRPGMNLGKYRVIHGYQADPLLRFGPARWIVGAVDGAIEAADLDALNSFREKIASGDRTNEPMTMTLEGTGDYLIGHSHCPVDLGWYINSGCWVGDHPSYIKVEDGIPTLHEWKK